MIEILKKSNLFAYLTDDELAYIAGKLKQKKVIRNQIVFSQNEAGESLYIVLSGLVKIFVIDKETGIEATLATLQTGEYFGEMALVSDHNRSATAKTVVETNLAEFNRATFTQIARENAGVSLKIHQNFARILSDRLSNTSQNLLKVMKTEPGKTKPTLNLTEYIMNRTEVKVVLVGGLSLAGVITRFGQNIMDSELTLEAGGAEFIVPYNKINYIEITPQKKTQKLY